jgi:hypothetical protein
MMKRECEREGLGTPTDPLRYANDGDDSDGCRGDRVATLLPPLVLRWGLHKEAALVMSARGGDWSGKPGVTADGGAG